MIDDDLHPDPALAVEHGGLSVEQATRILAALKGTPMNGARVADYLSMLDDHDMHLEITEPWWERFGDTASDSVALAAGVPEHVARRLVSYSLLALIAMPDPHLRHPLPVPRDVLRIAERAAMWSKGFAYSRSLTPSARG